MIKKIEREIFNPDILKRGQEIKVLISSCKKEIEFYEFYAIILEYEEDKLSVEYYGLNITKPIFLLDVLTGFYTIILLDNNK